MFLLDLSNCGPSGILRALYFFKMLFDVVFIVVPIGLIILLIMDFSKAAISGDENSKTKTFKLATKRIMYAVLVFFVPTIVSIVNDLLGEFGVDFLTCYENISLDAIESLEADEIAKEEAERIARLARIQKEKEIEEGIMNSDGHYIINGNGCDGLVYFDTGIFYKPGSNYKNGTPETKGSALYGYNKYFYNMLTTMINDAKKEGLTITMSTSDSGAWRPYEKQEYFWMCYQTKSCNNNNLAARPGTSNHGWGIASDLKYGNQLARDWAHKNASYYGLKFTVCDSYPNNCKEPWHIAPALQKTDDSVVRKCS